MKPDIALVLTDHSKRLAEQIVPKLSGFDANGAAMMSAMLAMIAEEWDRVAARRVAENAAIRAIFTQAGAVVRDDALAARLKALAATDDADLRISALDAGNDALRAALTDLHAHVEDLEGPEARALDESIWAELRQSVERRRISQANF